MRETISSDSEQRLLKRLRKGEDAAFEVFFDRYFPRVYRFALTRVDGDQDAAEEIAQETLCKVVRKLDLFRGEASLFTWICTFCRHEISAYFRTRRHQPVVSLVEDTPQIRAALESLSAESENQDDHLRRDQLVRLVHVALDHLSPRQSQVLQMKYLEGLSVKEIALRTSQGPKAVESLLTRARLAFRDGFSTLMTADQARMGN